MSESHPIRRLLRRVSGYLLVAGAVGAITLVVRWADPTPSLPTPVGTAGTGKVLFRLENAPFTAYSGGHKAWSLFARSVDLEHPLGASFSTLQSATLTDIRDGALYPASPNDTGPLTLSSPSANAPLAPAPASDTLGPPLATFHAGQGRYILGTNEPVSPDIQLLYTVRSQFKLTGKVDIQARSGDHLQSEALTILDLVNRRTGKSEQRIVCDSGAMITLKGAHIHANQMRYDPRERVVECLGGVRGAFKSGAVQTERAFWSLKDNVIRCPDTAAGTQEDNLFQGEGITLDLNHHKYYANHMTLSYRIRQGDDFSLPER